MQRAVTIHLEGRFWRLFGLRQCPAGPQALPPALLLSVQSAEGLKHNGTYRVVVECGDAAPRRSNWAEVTPPPAAAAAAVVSTAATAAAADSCKA
ncbi:hypothetical protein Emag_007554 [Eimeria magna]